MSCFIMNPESIRKIGYTLAAILDVSEFGKECTIATNAAESANLPKAFHQYYSRHRGYNAEGISEDLYMLNLQAYASRYERSPWEPFPDPISRSAYSLTRLPVYADHTEAPQEWHYHLLKLLHCWLYQTEEDATIEDEKRKALEAFANALSCQIVQHSNEYSKFRWGE